MKRKTKKQILAEEREGEFLHQMRLCNAKELASILRTLADRLEASEGNFDGKYEMNTDGFTSQSFSIFLKFSNPVD